jgi:hypothetical protein
LSRETHDFYQRCKEETIALLDVAQAVSKAGDDMNAKQNSWDSFNKAYWPPERRVLARNALRAAARSLLERIMKVDEGAAPTDGR